MDNFVCKILNSVYSCIILYLQSNVLLSLKPMNEWILKFFASFFPWQAAGRSFLKMYLCACTHVCVCPHLSEFIISISMPPVCKGPSAAWGGRGILELQEIMNSSGRAIIAFNHWVVSQPTESYSFDWLGSTRD